ncbi:hypothetical protein B0I35DRAFT_195482 [Stachybotrys elegans]|uniref:Uncharacterized protein n=1 Tax=Stachybotrys elegans TaxID=80388 RepID=A0A8K0SD18_9HYPO|nr:hypothetical protein B0I35DRAFT_195482 [Stachybotrys elegans]
MTPGSLRTPRCHSVVVSLTATFDSKSTPYAITITTMSKGATELLKEAAESYIDGKQDVRLAPNATTGADDFKYERSPDVKGVVVDRNSGSGYVQISGGGKQAVKIPTGLGESGYHYEAIAEEQSCMLYGRPTVWYIVPNS